MIRSGRITRAYAHSVERGCGALVALDRVEDELAKGVLRQAHRDCAMPHRPDRGVKAVDGESAKCNVDIVVLVLVNHSVSGEAILPRVDQQEVLQAVLDVRRAEEEVLMTKGVVRSAYSVVSNIIFSRAAEDAPPPLLESGRCTETVEDGPRTAARTRGGACALRTCRARRTRGGR